MAVFLPNKARFALDSHFSLHFDRVDGAATRVADGCEFAVAIDRRNLVHEKGVQVLSPTPSPPPSRQRNCSGTHPHAPSVQNVNIQLESYDVIANIPLHSTTSLLLCSYRVPCNLAPASPPLARSLAFKKSLVQEHCQRRRRAGKIHNSHPTLCN